MSARIDLGRIGVALGQPPRERPRLDRLSRSASWIMWLNPLLGADEYQPLVRGIKTVLPYVDVFLPIHNLHSLIQVVQQLESL